VETLELIPVTQGSLEEIVQVAALARSVFAGELDIEVADRLDQEVARLRETFDPERDFVLTAHAEGALAGGCIVGHQSDAALPTALLSWLVVAPAYRHRGLGRAILAHAIEICRERRVAVVRARCIVHRSAPVRLYWELGFRVTSLLGVPFEGQTRETILLEKRLTLPPASA
jgi:GNAT superfamily N-acetyltransferase